MLSEYMTEYMLEKKFYLWVEFSGATLIFKSLVISCLFQLFI